MPACTVRMATGRTCAAPPVAIAAEAGLRGPAGSCASSRRLPIWVAGRVLTRPNAPDCAAAPASGNTDILCSKMRPSLSRRAILLVPHDKLSPKHCAAPHGHAIAGCQEVQLSDVLLRGWGPLLSKASCTPVAGCSHAPVPAPVPEGPRSAGGACMLLLRAARLACRHSLHTLGILDRLALQITALLCCFPSSASVHYTAALHCGRLRHQLDLGRKWERHLKHCQAEHRARNRKNGIRGSLPESHAAVVAGLCQRLHRVEAACLHLRQLYWL